MASISMTHAVNVLRQQCQLTSTRPFKAKGSFVQRCPDCLLASFACFCPWQTTLPSNTHFILLMHRNEVHKPTNTGRLIADLFPDSTQAFLWSRIAPSDELLAEINNPDRQAVLLFTEKKELLEEKGLLEEKELPEKTNNDVVEPTIENQTENAVSTDKPLTVILLDGTWKQASRMASLGHWLQAIPRISLTSVPSDSGNDINEAEPYIRQAPSKQQLSTAQAAAYLLQQQGEELAATALLHYFSVFNLHSKSTRSNVPPLITESHHFLERLKG